MCQRCGDTLDQPGTEYGYLCRTCRLAPPPFARAVAYGPYEGRMRDAIHALKYDGMRPAAMGLGRALAIAIAQLAATAPADLLAVPVPLHRSKSSARGFNQARLLASEALAALRRTHPEWHLTLAADTLLRQRSTGTQAGLTPRQRRINVRGAFRVADNSTVAGRHILLIDDILTTGATARAAAQALLKAGAETVWVATLARARRTHAARHKTLTAWKEARLSGMPGNTFATVAETKGMFRTTDPPSL